MSDLISNLMKRIGEYAYLVGQIKALTELNEPEEAVKKIIKTIGEFENGSSQTDTSK